MPDIGLSTMYSYIELIWDAPLEKTRKVKGDGGGGGGGLDKCRKKSRARQMDLKKKILYSMRKIQKKTVHAE